MQTDRYIPEGFVPQLFNDVNAVAYIGERDGKPVAIAYSGKSRKAAFFERYMSCERRDERINNWVSALRRNKEEKDRRAAERKAFRHSLKVGDILCSCWGYEQTNVDFYQVVELKGKSTVVLQELAQKREYHNDMQGTCIAL